MKRENNFSKLKMRQHRLLLGFVQDPDRTGGVYSTLNSLMTPISLFLREESAVASACEIP